MKKDERSKKFWIEVRRFQNGGFQNNGESSPRGIDHHVQDTCRRISSSGCYNNNNKKKIITTCVETF